MPDERHWTTCFNAIADSGLSFLIFVYNDTQGIAYRTSHGFDVTPLTDGRYRIQGVIDSSAKEFADVVVTRNPAPVHLEDCHAANQLFYVLKAQDKQA
jgi:hypothetical protein